jgi:hypothetical protein
MNSLAAQAFVFFAAGYETSSTTMTFCLYELSLHQDIQNRLREEIDVVLLKHDGKLTYEGIQEMEYLDKVVSGKAPFVKHITETGRTLLNTAMSLEHLSLFQINLQSYLKIRTNHNLPVFLLENYFFFPSFVSLISMLYTVYTPPFVFACWCRFILYRDIFYDINFFLP